MFTTAKGSGHTDLVRTSLDDVAWERFDLERQPDSARADDPLFFRQKSHDKQAYIDFEVAGPGQFDQVVEDEEYPEATLLDGNRVAHVINNYKKSLVLTEEFMEDEQWEVAQNWVRMAADRARTTRDEFAMQESYGDAFSGATTNAGVSMINNSHTNLNGDTVDNQETGVMNADNFETLVTSLRLQAAQDGSLGSYHADGALFPVTLAAEAHEVLKSELKSGTGNNELNYFSKVYPGLVIGVSEWLDATYNSLNTNANTSYFVVSQNHEVRRIVRKGFTSAFVDPRFDSRGRGFYRLRFREEIHPVQYNGLAGSNGTV